MKQADKTIILVVLLILSNIFSACGLKGPPRPPITPVPAKPNKYRVEVREGCVELRWKAPAPDPENAPTVRWEVLRASAPGPGEEPIYRVIDVSPAPPYRDCSIERGQSAWYAVRGVSADGERGKPAGPITIVNPDPPVPPSSLRATPGDGFVDLVWLPPAGTVGTVPDPFVSGYNVYRSPDPGAFPRRPLNSTPLDALSYTDGPLDNGLVYYYEVRTVLAAEGVATVEGPAAGPVTAAAIDRVSPAAPVGLTAANGPEGVNLRWLRNQETDLAGYLVYRRPRGLGEFQSLADGPVPDPYFVDTGARVGGEYEYAVRAVDQAAPPNVSPFSEIQTVYIPP